jgi:hypothetical protein
MSVDEGWMSNIESANAQFEEIHVMLWEDM